MSSAHAATPSTATVRWSSNAQFATGTPHGLAIGGGSLTIKSPARPYEYVDPYGSTKARAFSYGYWTSPWVSTGFDAKTIIPSWDVGSVPSGTWVRIDMRARTATATGSWDRIADWSYGTAGTHRQSGTSQTNDLTRVDVDTLVANGSYKLRGWQLRVTLLSPVGTRTSPRLDSVGAVAASFATKSQAVSRTTMTSSLTLPVPMSSQMIHDGQFTQWGGGGSSWCSPTSTSMVLRYFRTGPAPADYSWSRYADSFVDHAARYTYDYRYDAAGNWPFNTAYAALYGLDSFVTRLNDLRDAEAFIRKGIPVVASVRYARGALTGAAVASSNGHLLVIVGFTKSGRVVVNDPAASSNAGVRRIYDRAQFERAWLGGSGGVSYIIHPTNKALPTSSGRW